MKKNYFLLLLLIVLIVPFSAFSKLPESISIQGRLLDSDGKAKPDGDYNITIKMYDSDDAGAVSIFETQRTAILRGGVFNVEIGSENEPLPEFSQGFWIGLTLEGEVEMEPRMKLNNVPYSFSSRKSEFAEQSYHAVKADSAGWSATATIADTANFARNAVLPIGAILIYAGQKKSIPTGWMICDGAGMRSAQYNKLFNVLGNSWGDGSDDADDSTDFNLPDLRGMFLRGVDDGAGIDPDAEFRQASKFGANEGDTVATVQLSSSNSLVSENQYFDQSSSFDVQYIPVVESNNYAYKNVGGNESRPINASVYYIIKVH